MEEKSSNSDRIFLLSLHPAMRQLSQLDNMVLSLQPAMRQLSQLDNMVLSLQPAMRQLSQLDNMDFTVDVHGTLQRKL